MMIPLKFWTDIHSGHTQQASSHEGMQPSVMIKYVCTFVGIVFMHSPSDVKEAIMLARHCDCNMDAL